MSTPPAQESSQSSRALEIRTVTPTQETQETQRPAETDGEGSPRLRNSKGWDGRMRIPKSAVLQNAAALSDPEYSDEENVLPGQQISADEDILESEESDTEEISRTQARIASLHALGLERFKKVARICLRQNLIQEIEGLDGLADSLQELDLYDNLIPRIRGLDKLTRLTFLDLSFNKIKHIKNIDHLENLKDIFLVANKISKIEGLAGLKQLKSLELGSNRIRTLENLGSLTSLRELWVAKNKITDISGLGGLHNLRLLSIQSNRIRDLSPLKDVPQLEELYISHNAIESLEGLEHNVNLHTIDISSNQVTSLKGLGPLAKLQELWASYNQIADFVDVERELRDKEALTTVYFEGNPLQLRAPALYRNKVRLALPQIKQIDATYVRV